MDVDIDAAGKRFGWFLEGFDATTERLISSRRLLMETAAVSRMTGEDATDVYAVIPGWRDEIEANLEGADPVDWDANDYFIAPGTASRLGRGRRRACTPVPAVAPRR